MKFDIFSKKKFKCNICGDKFRINGIKTNGRQEHP
jgi:uncharacterized protein (DUF2225 family)